MRGIFQTLQARGGGRAADSYRPRTILEGWEQFHGVEVWARCIPQWPGTAQTQVRPDRRCIKQAEDFGETTTPRGRPSREDAVTRVAPGPSPAKALVDRGQRLGLPLLAWVRMPTKGGSQGCLGRVWG